MLIGAPRTASRPLGAEDAATLVGDVASEPQSVVFEFKAMVRPEPLAKTCAASANSNRME